MIKKSAVKMVSLLWLGSMLGAILAFGTQVLLARDLGSAKFGVFFSSLSTITLLAPLAGFGIPQFWLRAFGVEGWSGIRWIKPSFLFIRSSAVILIVAVIGGAVLVDSDLESRNILVILSFYILGQLSVELVSSKLQLEERYEALALWQLLPHLMRFFMVSVTVVFFAKKIVAEIYAVFYSSVAVVFFIFALIEFKSMNHGGFRLKGHGDPKEISLGSIPTIRDAASESWPFGVAAFSYFIYFQSNIVILKYMSGSHEAGLYSVAFTIMTAVYLFPSVIYQRFLAPKVHRWATQEPEKLYRVYKVGNFVMLILGGLAMATILMLSGWAIPIFFGEEYRGAIMILKVLSVSAPIIFVAFSAGATLVTQQHMRTKVKYMMTVALLNIILNLSLIPLFNATGAAIATGISNSILLVLYLRGANKYVFQRKS